MRFDCHINLEIVDDNTVQTPRGGRITLTDTNVTAMVLDSSTPSIPGPGIYIDSSSIQFKNALNQVNPVQYTGSTKWLEVGGLSGWLNFTMMNGWTAFPGYDVPQYKLCPDGFVRFRGGMRPGTLTDGTIACQMITTSPEFRAVNNKQMPITHTAGTTNMPRVFIQGSAQGGTGYNVAIFGLAGATFASLEGVQFAVEHL